MHQKDAERGIGSLDGSIYNGRSSYIGGCREYKAVYATEREIQMSGKHAAEWIDKYCGCLAGSGKKLSDEKLFDRINDELYEALLDEKAESVIEALGLKQELKGEMLVWGNNMLSRARGGNQAFSRTRCLLFIWFFAGTGALEHVEDADKLLEGAGWAKLQPDEIRHIFDGKREKNIECQFPREFDTLSQEQQDEIWGAVNQLRKHPEITITLRSQPVDLKNLNFLGKDLSGKSFAGAKFHNADFTAADFTGADFSDVDLTKADTTNLADFTFSDSGKSEVLLGDVPIWYSKRVSIALAALLFLSLLAIVYLLFWR